VSETTSSVARSTARWPARSPGRPGGRPNRNSIPATRGAPTEAVNSGIIDNDTVAMPLASMTRWTSPTDRQQIGQTGTSRVTSTASSAIRAAIAGAVEVSSCRGNRCRRDQHHRRHHRMDCRDGDRVHADRVCGHAVTGLSGEPWNGDARQEPDQRGEDRAVGPVQSGPRMSAAQHGDLMPQHEQLRFL
jgi:hypothetical protein